MITVAALYCDPKGIYPHIPGVETWAWPWRDATKYEGPYPIVAHPPCGPWGRLRHLSKRDRADLAPLALEQVRRWGGVLEHPAGSLLWSLHGDDADPKKRGSQYMARPGEEPDCWGGYTVEVSQCDWGHVARKRTWLYLINVPHSALMTPEPREPTHWISGGRGRAGKKAKTTPVPPGILVASAQQRRRTPPAFAEYLVSLARAAGAARGAAFREASLAQCDRAQGFR
jgi:hypothetical protein